MAHLKELKPNAAVRGILPNGLITVVGVQWHGSAAVELTYKTPEGKVANELLYRHDEPRLEVVEQGRPWSFDGDGELFRLVSEAERIRLAHLFDPVLAVHTSVNPCHIRSPQSTKPCCRASRCAFCWPMIQALISAVRAFVIVEAQHISRRSDRSRLQSQMRRQVHQSCSPL